MCAWVPVRQSEPSMSDKESLLTPGCALTVKYVNFAQGAMSYSVAGFMSTLLQYKPLPTKLTNNGIQIIHCCGFHWVTAYKKIPSTMPQCIIPYLTQLMILYLKYVRNYKYI